MTRRCAFAAVLVAGMSCCLCAARGQTTRPAGVDAAGQARGVLKHLRIDPAGRSVEFDAQVVLTRGELELMVCLAGTKEHESILATQARPSHVHAALLALGVVPGKPARWTRGAGGKSVYAPPAGAEIEINLRYVDSAGNARTVPGRTWLQALRRTGPPEPVRWVFVGSALLDDGAYLADETGEIVSVANFPASVVDVPFPSSTNQDSLAFAANTEVIPPVGTAVTVVLIAPTGSERADVARAVFRIDRFGRYELNGLDIVPDEVERWAGEFKAKHSRPYVVIRPAPQAMVFDVERLRAILAHANIDDVEVKMRPPAGQILPRTSRQAAESLQWWRDQFARYDDLIIEPGQQAQVVLRQIEFRREELADLIQLWSAYRDQLSAALGAYRTATQPSRREAAQ